MWSVLFCATDAARQAGRETGKRKGELCETETGQTFFAQPGLRGHAAGHCGAHCAAEYDQFRRGRYGQRDAGKLRRCGHCRGKPGRTAVFHFDVVRLRPFIRRQRAHCAVLGQGRHRAHPQGHAHQHAAGVPGVAGHHRRLPAHAGGHPAHLYQR